MSSNAPTTEAVSFDMVSMEHFDESAPLSDCEIQMLSGGEMLVNNF